MPTPSPIIRPMAGAKSGTVMRLLKTMMDVAPIPTVTRAAATVAPMAITEPSTAINTKTAKARPIASDSGGRNSANQIPPTSTSRPSMELSSSSSIRPSMVLPMSWASVPLVPGGRLTFGVGDPAGFAPLLGYPQRPDERVIGRDDVGVLKGLHPGEQLAHRGSHAGVVDPLLGPEHDRPGRAGTSP